MPIHDRMIFASMPTSALSMRTGGMSHVWRNQKARGQSALAGLGVLLGAGLTVIAWHATNSNYRNGSTLVDPGKDAHLHDFGHSALPFGLTLLATSLALTLHGLRRARPRWILLVTAPVVAAGLFGLAYVLARYETLASVCACGGG